MMLFYSLSILFFFFLHTLLYMQRAVVLKHRLNKRFCVCERGKQGGGRSLKDSLPLSNQAFSAALRTPPSSQLLAAPQKAFPSLLFGALRGRRDCSSPSAALGEAGPWQQAPGVVQLLIKTVQSS